MLVGVFFFVVFGVSGHPKTFLPKKISCVKTDQPLIALTIDDGPKPGFTEQLLKIFDDAQIRVTFFTVGKMLEKYPELGQAIIAAGHEIGSHSYNHLDMTTMSEAEVVEDVERSRRVLDSQGFNNVCLFRPPYGKWDDDVLKVLNDHKFIMVLWSAYTCDFGCEYPDQIRRRALALTSPGGIILCHNGVDATVKALPEIIEQLKQKGFKFVTVSELIEKTYLPEGVALTDGMKNYAQR